MAAAAAGAWRACGRASLRTRACAVGGLRRRRLCQQRPGSCGEVGPRREDTQGAASAAGLLPLTPTLAALLCRPSAPCSAASDADAGPQVCLSLSRKARWEPSSESCCVAVSPDSRFLFFGGANGIITHVLTLSGEVSTRALAVRCCVHKTALSHTPALRAHMLIAALACPRASVSAARAREVDGGPHRRRARPGLQPGWAPALLDLRRQDCAGVGHRLGPSKPLASVPAATPPPHPPSCRRHDRACLLALCARSSISLADVLLCSAARSCFARSRARPAPAPRWSSAPTECCSAGAPRAPSRSGSQRLHRCPASLAALASGSRED